MNANGDHDPENGDWLDEFPMEEEYTDCAGTIRKFEVELIETPGGFLGRATESGKEDGYEFEALSEANPSRALWSLRNKIRRGLATRYLEFNGLRRSFTHDRVEGRISYGGVVIDGEYIGFEDFANMLETYEGFGLSLRIVDSAQDPLP